MGFHTVAGVLMAPVAAISSTCCYRPPTSWTTITFLTKEMDTHARHKKLRPRYFRRVSSDLRDSATAVEGNERAPGSLLDTSLHHQVRKEIGALSRTAISGARTSSPLRWRRRNKRLEDRARIAEGLNTGAKLDPRWQQRPRQSKDALIRHG